ncbi:hypothetical protein HGRIS_004655 [Hohenbuehelia grisea]|uniref:Uncharacterized protein n=1 Tax=Hohenbuehelia grisea TaxID=104357 RepID=A0ABR3JCK2_9AGAR
MRIARKMVALHSCCRIGDGLDPVFSFRSNARANDDLRARHKCLQGREPNIGPFVDRPLRFTSVVEVQCLALAKSSAARILPANDDANDDARSVVDACVQRVRARRKEAHRAWVLTPSMLLFTLISA